VRALDISGQRLGASLLREILGLLVSSRKPPICARPRPDCAPRVPSSCDRICLFGAPALGLRLGTGDPFVEALAHGADQAQDFIGFLGQAASERSKLQGALAQRVCSQLLHRDVSHGAHGFLTLGQHGLALCGDLRQPQLLEASPLQLEASLS